MPPAPARPPPPAAAPSQQPAAAPSRSRTRDLGRDISTAGLAMLAAERFEQTVDVP